MKKCKIHKNENYTEEKIQTIGTDPGLIEMVGLVAINI